MSRPQVGAASAVSGGPNRVLVVLALVVVLIGLLAFGGVQASRIRTDAKQRHEQARVVKAARSEVLALTGISATTTDEQIKALLDGMTDRLKSEFAAEADAFRQAMITSKVRSQGQAISVGLTTFSARHATAVVAAAALVSNARTTHDEDRRYRLKLTLQKVQGRWLVDTMDFVS